MAAMAATGQAIREVPLCCNPPPIYSYTEYARAILSHPCLPCEGRATLPRHERSETFRARCRAERALRPRRASGWCVTGSPCRNNSSIDSPYSTSCCASDGSTGSRARDFTDYGWLLAGGVGPMEAVEGRTSGRQATPHLAAFAERHAPRQRKSVDEVILRAKAEFPKFEASIRALCK